MRNRHNGLRRVVTVAAVVGMTIVGGIQAASAAPAPHPDANATVTVLFASTKLAVSSIRHEPQLVRVLAPAVIAESKALLASHPHTGSDPNSPRAALVAAASAATIPGTNVGGLNLDAYCQSIGDVSSYTPDPGNEGPGAAYTWCCVSATGAQSPIFMQRACFEQYPGQATIAYPQDTNNAYSWICIVPTAGTFSDPGSNTSVTTVTATNGSATLITNPTSSYLTVDNGGSSAAVLVNSNGSGSMGYDGSSGGSVLTYNGSGGGSVLTFNGSNGGSALTYDGSGGGSG